MFIRNVMLQLFLYNKELSIAILLLSHVQWAQSVPISKITQSSDEPVKPDETDKPQAIEQYENYFNEIHVEDENAEAKTRNAVQSPLQHWPERTIFYKISPQYTPAEAQNVREAVRVFGEKTCINFKEYTDDDDGSGSGAAVPTNKRYVRYTKSPDMCGTKVGYQPVNPPGGPHDVMLNPYCLTQRAVIQHETMHVLGLYHEQSRPDRNKHIKVEYSNIPQKYWSQFMSYPEIYTTTYNVPYDYESLMHYSQNAFAKDPSKPTMRARDGNNIIDRKMGQLNGPSEGDLQKIRSMYRCE